MPNPFSEIMSQRSDTQLAEILTLKRDEYEADALLAAEQEVQKRQLNINELIPAAVQTEVEKAKEPVNIDKKDIGLNVGLKALTFLLPVILMFLGKFIFITLLEIPPLAIISFPATIILQVIIFRELKAKGYLKMAKDFKSWTLNCWIFFVGLFVLQMILQMIAK